MKFFKSLSQIIIDRLPLFVFSCILLSLPAGLNQMDSDGGWHFAKALFLFSLIESFSISAIFCLIDKFLKGFFKWPCFIFLLLLAEVELFVFIHFGTRMSSMIMSFVLQTNIHETGEFMNTFVYTGASIPVIISLIIFIALFYWLDKLWRKRIKYKNDKIQEFNGRYYKIACPISIIVFIISLLLIIDISISKSVKIIPPAYTTLQSYINSLSAVGNHSEEISNIREAIKEVHIDSCSYKSPIIIVVIGESYNKYHSNLYGYRLNTCPNLLKEKRNGNLFVFSNAVSPMASTDFAMKYFYSTKSLCNDDSEWSHNPLFPAIFKKAGYDVRLFDNQCTQTKGDVNLDYQCSYFLNPDDINKNCFDYRNTDVFGYDGEMVNESRTHLSQKSNQLVIFHLMGQHFGADLRYPHTDQFAYFNASNIKRTDLKMSQRQQIAYYDNATLYNDYVIKKIIDLFSNKNAILIYFSDHGEQIYDNHARGFGRKFTKNINYEDIKCQNEIPFMIWCSDKYIKSHAEIIHRISKSVGNPIMNDDICYLLFDLAGIQYKGNKPNRNFISDFYNKRYHRMINENYDYDIHYNQIRKTRLLTESTE